MTTRPRRKRALDRVVTAAIALLAALVARAPFHALRRLGGAVGALVHALGVRTEAVRESLDAAGFADASIVARGVYRSLGTSLVELLWAEGRSGSDLASHVRLTDRAARALARARVEGAVVATAHVGAWDLVACRVAADAPLVVLTKRLANASLDARWQRLRAAKGVSLVSGAGALAACRRALRERKLVALMVDQAPAKRAGSVSFPFLGAAAWHELAPALLASRAGVPLLVAWGTREADGSHVIDVPLVLAPPVRRDRDAAIEATRAVSAALEEHVRAHPTQWLWLHRRWKQPAPRGTRAPWTTTLSASAPARSGRASSSAPASTRT